MVPFHSPSSAPKEAKVAKKAAKKVPQAKKGRGAKQSPKTGGKKAKKAPTTEVLTTPSAAARGERGSDQTTVASGAFEIELPTSEGVTWFGDPWLVEFKDGMVTVHDLTEGEVEVLFDGPGLDGGDDLLLVTELFAPGVTHKERSSDDAYQRACRKLKARVEGDLIRKGSSSLHYAEHSGDEERDFFVYWSLSGKESRTGKRTAPGSYPVELTLGGQQVARFIVHWGGAARS